MFTDEWLPLRGAQHWLQALGVAAACNRQAAQHRNGSFSPWKSLSTAVAAVAVALAAQVHLPCRTRAPRCPRRAKPQHQPPSAPNLTARVNKRTYRYVQYTYTRYMLKPGTRYSTYQHKTCTAGTVRLVGNQPVKGCNREPCIGGKLVGLKTASVMP